MHYFTWDLLLVIELWRTGDETRSKELRAEEREVECVRVGNRHGDRLIECSERRKENEILSQLSVKSLMCFKGFFHVMQLWRQSIWCLVCLFVSCWINLLQFNLSEQNPVLVSDRMTLTQKLGNYHLFMGNASETEIMALFACLSSLKNVTEMLMEQWQLFQPLFSLSSCCFSHYPSPILPLCIPSAQLINLSPAQYSTAWAHHRPYWHSAFHNFTATLFPSNIFLACRSSAPLFCLFSFRSGSTLFLSPSPIRLM